MGRSGPPVSVSYSCSFSGILGRSGGRCGHSLQVRALGFAQHMPRHPASSLCLHRYGLLEIGDLPHTPCDTLFFLLPCDLSYAMVELPPRAPAPALEVLSAYVLVSLRVLLPPVLLCVTRSLLRWHNVWSCHDLRTFFIPCAAREHVDRDLLLGGGVRCIDCTPTAFTTNKCHLVKLLASQPHTCASITHHTVPLHNPRTQDPTHTYACILMYAHIPIMYKHVQRMVEVQLSYVSLHVQS